MIPNDMTKLANLTMKYPDITDAGLGWSSGKQAAHQIYALLITLGIAIVSGALTGTSLRD